MTDRLGRPHAGGYIETLRQVRGFVNAGNQQRQIERLEHGVFSVPSERFPGASYQVFREGEGMGWLCTCPDFLARREPCKHIVEVLFRYFPREAPPEPERRRLSKVWYEGARRFPRAAYRYLEGPR